MWSINRDSPTWDLSSFIGFQYNNIFVVWGDLRGTLLVVSLTYFDDD